MRLNSLGRVIALCAAAAALPAAAEPVDGLASAAIGYLSDDISPVVAFNGSGSEGMIFVTEGMDDGAPLSYCGMARWGDSQKLIFTHWGFEPFLAIFPTDDLYLYTCVKSPDSPSGSVLLYGLRIPAPQPPPEAARPSEPRISEADEAVLRTRLLERLHQQLRGRSRR